MFNRWLTGIGPNLLLLGPRRAGKTTLLRNLFPDWPYQTLDDLDLLTEAKRDPKGVVRQLQPRGILDEVQRVPELTLAIKQGIDEGHLEILMSGSSGLRLLEAAADTLAGRIDLRHLPTTCWGEPDGPPTQRRLADPLSFTEVREAHRRLDQTITYGGFPEVVTASSDEERQALLRRFRDTYFTRDLAQLANLENITGLLALLQHLGRSIGSLTEAAGISRQVGLSQPTVRKYMNALAQSDLTFPLMGYQYGPVKRYIRAPKIYFADSGILTALGIEISEGQRFENFVIAEFEKRRKLGFLPGDGLFYHRSTNGAEIDLVVELPDEVWAIEIKATRNLDRGNYRNLREFAIQSRRQLRKYVIYRGDEFIREGEIEAIPAASLCGSTFVA